ncbi:hypothetical protein ACFOW4_05025 [Micromonospora sp. GCM10011542]|uniref:hypothetical protein n=1 Tax=Micromonospora sp. GCM10011542 TaxID=3317337 RepID=UPI00361A0C6E
MTTLWVVVGAFVVLGIASFGYVAWRDRRRQSSADDSTAARDARSVQERYAAERHAQQGDTWLRGRDGTSG